MEGVWEMQGYGWIFDIDASQVATYDTTKISCLPSATYPKTMVSDGFSVSEDLLTLRIGLSTYTLNRLDKLPDLCTVTLSRKQKKDPIFNFEVLWNTFQEQYAYFDLREAQWDALYEKYRPQVTAKTDQVDLYKICYTMLNELGDGHVDIEAPDKIMDKAFPSNSDDDTIDFKGLAQDIATQYVKDLKAHNYTKSVWGKINDNVGFLQVNEMVAQAHYGITPDMDKKDAQKLYVQRSSQSENHMQDEVDGMSTTMKQVLKDIDGTKYLIIDVRFNGGGFDAVSYEILKHLITQDKVVFKKHARLGETTTAPYTYTLTPAEAHYDGQVYFLQSAFSGSATETMLLASLQLPNTHRLGTPSEGILSDALAKVLPNEWDFTLSNEAYLTPDGINYEDKGIPVTVPFEYHRDEASFYTQLKNELSTGDKAIEWVLAKAKQ